MGNRSKRGRPDPDAPDPVTEWQEESRWSGYTRYIRWPWVAGSLRTPRAGRMPTFAQWLAIALVVALLLGAGSLLVWGLNRIP